MKRNMELVRKILFALEEHESGFAPRGLNIEGFTPEEIAYHAHLMADAELITAVDTTNSHSKGPESMPTGITWKGHDFIDAGRSDTIWNKAMQKVKAAGGAVTFSALTELLKKLVAERLGL